MVIPVPSDLYNGWFLVQVSTPELEVDYMVMNELVAYLPQTYTLPDTELVAALVC